MVSPYALLALAFENISADNPSPKLKTRATRQMLRIKQLNSEDV